MYDFENELEVSNMIGLACAHDSPLTSLAFSILIGQLNKVIQIWLFFSFTVLSSNVNKGDIFLCFNIGTFQKNFPHLPVEGQIPTGLEFGKCLFRQVLNSISTIPIGLLYIIPIFPRGPMLFHPDIKNADSDRAPQFIQEKA